jgi:clan AA aspartic protease
LGFIRIPVIFGDVLKKKTREVFFLVDTGLFFPIIPLSVAEEFNIKPLAEVELILANGKRTKADVSLAYFKIMDREGVFQVVLVDSPEPLLGVIVLEGLGFKVDPVTGKLEYSRPYGLIVLRSS